MSFRFVVYHNICEFSFWVIFCYLWHINAEKLYQMWNKYIYINSLMQKICNSIDNSLELCLFGTKPSIFSVLNNSTHAWLTHWGRVTHICVSKIIIIGSDNGLSPGRRQAIIWTNAGILLIEPSGTNFSEILIEIHTFSFKKISASMS